MKQAAPALLLALLVSTAHAQGVTSPAPPIIAVTPDSTPLPTLAPAPVQAVPTPAPPVQAPPPAVAAPTTPPVPPATPPAPAPTAPAQPPAPVAPPGQASPPPAAPANDWQPRGTVELQALDKVTARTTALAGKVGDVLHFGSLSITVTSCVARPSDQKVDYAAFLDITDSHEGAPGFHGWMLAAEPGLSMLEHPLYDIRLTACR